MVFEQAPAEIAEQRRVEGPQDRGQEDERHEAHHPAHVHEPGGEGRRGAAARDEAGDDEHVAPALAEETLGPVESLLGALAAEETADDRLADEAAEPVGRVVADERARGADGDHRRQRELSARRLNAADDHRRLARKGREERVADADPEQQRIRPDRPRQEVDEAVEEGEHHYRRARMENQFLPLAGVRVVDVTSSLAGPYCTEILAALGADVVKVEHPERGDEARAWGPPFWEDASVMFYAANLSKRSLALDLKRGRDVLLRLVDGADVFLQSLRPGTAERLGFGPDALRARNPRLVYCDIGAFGRTGPLRERPGYDPLLQAFGGIISVTGEHDRPGVRVGTSIVDQGTGLWAAVGIVAALYAGGGRTVDVSLFETAAALIPYQVTAYLRTGVVPGRYGTAFPLIAPYQVFHASDGDVMIAAANDGLFSRLCTALGLDELPPDPRFATNPDRLERREELAALIQARVAEWSRDELVALLVDAGVPAAPVNDIGEVADHEQTRALGLIQDVPEPTRRPPPLL